jgi:glucose/arabinose dehydrogenase
MRIRFFLTLIIPVLLLVAAGCDKSDNSDDGTVEPPDLPWPEGDTRIVKTGLNFPWEILWGKDDKIWMTERSGKVSRINPRDGTTEFSFNIPDVVSQGEGGLLGMVQHPDFTRNGFLYVVYNYSRSGTYTEKVVRYTYDASNNSISSPQVLIDNIPAANIHNGSRLVIVGDKLFITTGDANDIRLVQNRGSLAGKVLRINLDGSIPSDNPTAGSPVWTLGHRNPQGMVYANNTLYISDHGSSIEDELNIIERNQNYGWSNVSGPCNEPGEIDFCNTNNVREPLWSTGSRTIAVCGLDYYNNDRIPGWRNSLLMATLKDATLYQFQLSSNGQSITGSREFFRGNWGRLRDICISPAGRVYVCTSNGGNNDRLVEISKPE